MKTTCGIFIVDQCERILICHPTNHPWDVWSIPKGLIDEGETPLEAAVREVYEETSLILDTNAEFEELPYNVYTSKKKRVKPFIHYHKNVISISDLSCESFVHKEDKEPFPEVDYFRMVNIDTAGDILHETQSFFIKNHRSKFLIG